jgi:DNA mismatch repair protein MutS2
MLADIHRLRIQMAEARDEAYAGRSDAQILSDRLRGRLANIEQERRELLDEARRGIAEEVESLRAEARALRRRLQAAAAPIAAVVEVEKATERLVREASPVDRTDLSDVPVVYRELRVGDTVWVEPLNATGQVLSLGDERAEVQVGPARTRVRLSALRFRARRSEGWRSDDQPLAALRTPAVSSPGVRVDLRGLASDDALDRLDRHLDSAWRAGLPWLHIIHGKGTGTLRRAVRGFLVDHPLVSGYERGDPRQGGEGVTIAKLGER